ncbi:MAG: cytidine deaminase [Lasallia pustulata]|uniref:Cytidine deaminase n=1 Tax=Lasallia pustulata TaxID=136370 RepID=A0A5M8PVX6_9LECA|nr:MAG: cytidine deaminase [Lasallia pustulata]
MAGAPTIAPSDHSFYMRLAISLAHKSNPLPSNFRVGAVLVDQELNEIIATGYTLELPGNTHAEQCCLLKLAAAHNVSEEAVGEKLPDKAVIYTTIEPCGKRLSGNMSCVERILQTRKAGTGAGGVQTVYVGVTEPEKFVGENTGRVKLEAAGIGYLHVAGFEQEILKIATAGHGKDGESGRRNVIGLS